MTYSVVLIWGLSFGWLPFVPQNYHYPLRGDFIMQGTKLGRAINVHGRSSGLDRYSPDDIT